MLFQNWLKTIVTRTIKTKGVQTFMGKATNWIFFSKYKSYLSMPANDTHIWKSFKGFQDRKKKLSCNLEILQTLLMSKML